MAHHSSQRFATAMTLVFSLGLVAALLAWGPIHWSNAAEPVVASDANVLRWEWAHWGSELQLGVALLLIALALWCQILFARSQRRVCDVTWPWRVLVLIAAVRACLWVAQSSVASSGSLAVIQFASQFCQAGLGVVLCWGLMAQGLKTRCKPWVACLVYVSFLVVATAWYLLVPGVAAASRGGDARALVLLQLMPLVMVAGVSNLPERGMNRGESLFLIAAYGVTWLTTWLPGLSHSLDFPQLELLMAALPWASYCALCLLVLVPLGKLLQAQQNQLLNATRSDRRSLAPAWLPHFRFDALAAPNRRHNS